MAIKKIYNKIIKKIKKLIQIFNNNKLYSCSFSVLLLLFILSFCFDLISSGAQDNPVDEYTFVYYMATAIITGIIAAIAYSQFQKINDNLAKDYLLKIDERWRGVEIIKARMVIHKLYLAERKKFENMGISDERKLHKSVGIKIDSMASKGDKRSVESFVLLLNFLDFMETIGYYFNSGKLQKKDLQELFGLSLKFNYEIFEPYIKNRRKRHDNDAFYSQFKKLYKVIK